MKQVGDYIYFTDEEWPLCAIPGCTNRCCLRLESKYCYPHTGSGKALEEIMDELSKRQEVSGG